MKQINTYISEKLRLSAKPQYTCQPKDKDKLRDIIIYRIENEGPECDLNDIDTSKIINMAWLFDVIDYKIFENFNGDISLWDVSNVKDMYGMFKYCEKFDCDISKWNVSNVTDMSRMFIGCKKFNCNISKWNTSNLIDMRCMFSGCEKFNQDLDSWNVSKIEDMKYAFNDCPTTPVWYDRKRW